MVYQELEDALLHLRRFETVLKPAKRIHPGIMNKILLNQDVLKNYYIE